MRKLIAAVAIAALAVTLTGCAVQPAAERTPAEGNTRTFVLSDGRTVTCIYYNGLSCDWEGAE